jgi:FAD-dependent urate hydroxylase
LSVVSILGAGPYGLAAAAHLKAAGVDFRILGQPMSFWSRCMPTGMLLRSPRVASSISDPRGELDLDGFSRATGTIVGSPVPLESFIEYGHWFQSTVVTDVDHRHVERVERSDRRFVLSLHGGETLTVDRVVVAAGIAAFAHIPRAFRELSPDVVSHASHHVDLGRFAGRRVLVVGGGQSALESAALLYEGGAKVELAARAGGVHWLGQHGWLRSLGPVSTLLYAPPEVGPPLLSQLVRNPGWVHRLPAKHRHAIDRRSIRPAGAGWLRPRVDGIVQIRTQRTVTRADAVDHGVVVTFDDAVQETYDHVLLGTGYRVDLARYPFLCDDLLGQIRRVNGYPLLGRGFESSVPGLHFIGATAAWNFGPLMRFVAGTPFAATAVARHLRSRATRTARRAVAST